MQTLQPGEEDRRKGLISNFEEENGKGHADIFSLPTRKQFQVTADTEVAFMTTNRDQRIRRSMPKKSLCELGSRPLQGRRAPVMAAVAWPKRFERKDLSWDE